MNELLLFSFLSLSGVGIVCALILYAASKKFAVEENPLIENINALLPQANCGGCGYPGCKQFSQKLADSQDLQSFNCPVGGKETMKQIATLMKLDAQEQVEKIAVLKCQGSRSAAPDKIIYQGIQSCSLMHQQSCGSHTCQYGCLGGGDCVRVCTFHALSIDQTTGLPVVSEKDCTSCGACVKVCPRNLFELRAKNKGNRVYVACMNQEKGAIARKNCSVACIGCQKCVKLLSNEKYATLENNLAKIHDAFHLDMDEKQLNEWGKKLQESCPTKSIVYTGNKT